jgi:DNA-binding NarL/FixJ family response regulator
MIRVFIVDDHEIVRRGVSDLIDIEPDLEVVGEASLVGHALGRIAATAPDVAVLDVRLPDGSGIDLCRAIRSEHPSVSCLILTAYDDDQASYAAVLAGASGYVLKDIRGQRLLESIRAVAAGASLIDRSMSERIVAEATAQHASDAVSDLTPREHDILRLIADGLTNRQIGDHLGLAEKTVKNYISTLFAKLGVERRTQAAVLGADLLRETRSTGDQRP